MEVAVLSDPEILITRLARDVFESGISQNIINESRAIHATDGRVSRTVNVGQVLRVSARVERIKSCMRRGWLSKSFNWFESRVATESWRFSFEAGFGFTSSSPTGEADGDGCSLVKCFLWGAAGFSSFSSSSCLIFCKGEGEGEGETSRLVADL
jgi:hypothetical protein